MKFFRAFILNSRFFYSLSAIIGIMLLSFAWSQLFYLALGLLILLGLALLSDIFFLFVRAGGNAVTVERSMAKLLSLNNENEILLNIHSNFRHTIEMMIIDDLPVQLQLRDQRIPVKLESREEKTIRYIITPKERGVYKFGHVNLVISSRIGLASRYLKTAEPFNVPVYPSIIDLKRYELLLHKRTRTRTGLKKKRAIGQSYEFEQIKTYVIGDDYRYVNWKATSRTAELQVNQYQEERSQQVYCIIDSSRSMLLPFHGLSLLDYAVNASVVLANTALKKYDKAGFISFSGNIDQIVLADHKRFQMRRILEVLYKQKESSDEANYEKLYHTIKNQVKGRSILILFTNFESPFALERNAPILAQIAKQHVLLLVLFKNEEIETFTVNSSSDLLGIYEKGLALDYLNQKQTMISALTRNNIRTIYSIPSKITLDTFNKYLELKDRSLI
jgi:uncharacterized protein (DUF58 family)